MEISIPALLSARTDDEIRQIADALADESISKRQSTLPRGTIERSAERGFRDPQEQARIGELASVFSARQAPQTVVAVQRLLAERGDEAVFHSVIPLLRDETIPLSVRQASLSILRVVGGPIAALILKSLSERESPIQYLAQWQLRELQTGGTIDIAQGITRARAADNNAQLEVEVASADVKKAASLVQLNWNAQVLSYEFASELDPEDYHSKYAVYLEAFRCRLLELVESTAFGEERLAHISKSVEQLRLSLTNDKDFYSGVFRRVAADLLPLCLCMQPEVARALEKLRTHSEVIEELNALKHIAEKGLRDRISTFRMEVEKTRHEFTSDDTASIGPRLAEHCQAGLELTQEFGMPQYRWASADVIQAAISEFESLISFMGHAQSIDSVSSYIAHLSKRAEFLDALRSRYTIVEAYVSMAS